MMRALWTSGSGMIAQQLNVDTISNNLANVNTTGFKKQRAEFKDLLYETMDRAYILEGKGKPVNLQVGHGVSLATTVRSFEGGSPVGTSSPLDLCIDGEGFFNVLTPKGEEAYTRDGSFKISVSEEGNKLTTSEGGAVLDSSGNEIVFGSDVNISSLKISPEGDISYTLGGEAIAMGQRIGVVKFPNRYALESIGNNYYVPTSAAGTATPDEDLGTRSAITQFALESSNVQVVEEMVKLIVAQRAYEVNSKSIQSADEMLGQANNLKR